MQGRLFITALILTLLWAPAALLIAIGSITGDQLAQAVGIGCGVAGVVGIFMFIWLGLRGRRAGTPLLTVHSTEIDPAAYAQARSSHERLQARVQSHTSLGTEQGVARFGTSLELIVATPQGEEPGALSDYLTLAEIARTQPGAEITVSPVPGHAKLYILAP